jgi:hypothetical protein
MLKSKELNRFKKTIFKDAAHSFKENTSADKVIANTNKMGKNNNTFTGKMDQNKNNGKIVENNNTGKMVKNTNTDKMAEMISGNGEFNKHKKIGGKRKSDVHLISTGIFFERMCSIFKNSFLTVSFSAFSSLFWYIVL